MKTDSIPLVERAVRSLTDTLRATLQMGRIVVQPLPGCPGLVLGLINADFPTGPLPPDVMHTVIRQPAYWALFRFRRRRHRRNAQRRGGGHRV